MRDAIHKFVESLPRDFVCLVERSLFDASTGEVKNLHHAVEWVKAEPQRFPHDFSRRAILRLGLVLPAAAVLWWPRPVYAAGYVGTYPIPPVVTGPTVTVAAPTGSDDGPQIRTAIESLYNGGVSTTGGTIALQAGGSYSVRSSITCTGAVGTGRSNFAIDGNGATLTAHSTLGVTAGNEMLHLTRVKNFIVKDLTLNGNRTQRGVVSNGAPHNLRLTECNSVAISGGLSPSGLIANVTTTDSPEDNLEMRAADNTGADTSRYTRNIIVYKVTSARGGRLGTALINTNNIAILGGTYNANGSTVAGVAGVSPQGAIDVEGNTGSAIPSNINILVRGCLFTANLRCGFKADHVSGGNYEQQITVEGNNFQGGATTAPNAGARGCAVSLGVIDALIQSNDVEGFGPIYETVDALMDLQGQSAAQNCRFTDNHFNNNSANLPCINATNNCGTGHQADGNRRFNCTGVIVNDPSSLITKSDNTTVTTETHPTIMPPWSVYVGQDCIP